jgi:hypothetical protein
MWDKERIVVLTKAANGSGRLPAVWKRARHGVIRKLGTDCYPKPKAYHCISLQSNMEPVIVKVVAQPVSEEVKRRELLSDRHFGNRMGQTAINVVVVIVDRAHAAWTNRRIT